MVSINVQFADATAAIVVAYFAGPQDENAWPNQSVIEASDARWKAFYGSMLPINQGTLPTPD